MLGRIRYIAKAWYGECRLGHRLPSGRQSAACREEFGQHLSAVFAGIFQQALKGIGNCPSALKHSPPHRHKAASIITATRQIPTSIKFH